MNSEVALPPVAGEKVPPVVEDAVVVDIVASKEKETDKVTACCCTVQLLRSEILADEDHLMEKDEGHDHHEDERIAGAHKRQCSPNQPKYTTILL